ncbi:alpha/beta fold hydrolase [Streptomyces venezuelae]|uniref:alpha/beta fold hydrolase n=1 Tax=Streptomyces venezuelae TaxID=54571 RepID=UPI00168547D9|nr:alpha/beta hydrolase [Streptomyces venezuelae]
MTAERTKDRPRWMAQNSQAFFATHLGNNVSTGLMDWMVRQCLDCSAIAAVEAVNTAFRTDLRTEAAAIEVPTLILHGDADASAPVALCGRRLAKTVPDSLYKEYSLAGHGICVTHAEAVNRDLLDFIGGA